MSFRAAHNTIVKTVENNITQMFSRGEGRKQNRTENGTERGNDGTARSIQLTVQYLFIGRCFLTGTRCTDRMGELIDVY